MADDVFVYTVDGTYKIPSADLEQYRTEEDPAEVEGFNFGTFDMSSLRPGQPVMIKIGESTTAVPKSGHVVFSVDPKNITPI